MILRGVASALFEGFEAEAGEQVVVGRQGPGVREQSFDLRGGWRRQRRTVPQNEIIPRVAIEITEQPFEASGGVSGAGVQRQVKVAERLPTVFKPVFPPPYLNGGPRAYLSWVVECRDKAIKPGTVADWLESRLPQSVDDLSAWPTDE